MQSRGIETACRLCVCLSVTLVDQDNISWESWKLIARTIIPTPSLFVAQMPSTYSQGNNGKFWETRVEVGKSGVLEHKSGNTSETRKDHGWKVTMEGELTNALSNGNPRPPTHSPFPRLGVCNPNPKLQSLIKLRTSNSAGTFTGSIRTKAH